VDVDAMDDQELRGLLLRGLLEVAMGEGEDASLAFARIREECFGA